MLVYSQWRPDGGYDYYEATSQVAPLGDDLGVPKLEVINGIGAPSVEAGRTIPRGARHVGTGELPLGVVAPMERGRIGAVSSFIGDMPPWLAFMAGAAAIGFVWLVWGQDKK